MRKPIVCFTLSIFLGTAVTAQPTATVSPTATASATPLASSEVVPRLEASLVFLRDLGAVDGQQVENSRVQISILEREVSDAARLLPSQISANLTPADLEQQEKRWHEYQERLESVRRTFDAQSETVERTRTQSLEQLGFWRAALEQPESLSLPKEILEQIPPTATRLREAEEGLGKQQAALFALSTRISGLDTRIDSSLTSLGAARRERVSRLLQVDESPLWQADWEQLRANRLGPELRSSLQLQMQAFYAYCLVNAQGFLYHLLSLVGLYFLLGWAGRRIAAWAEQEPALVDPAANLKSPLPTAILLSVLLAGSFYPHPPILQRALLAGSALIPAILVLRRLLPPLLHATLYLLVLLFCVDQARMVLTSLTLLSRLIFVGELVAVVLCLTYTLRRGSLIPAWDRRLLGLGLTLFSVSLAAIVFGFVGLGHMLGDAALRSLYLAVFLFSITEVLRVLVLLALRTPPLAYLKSVREQEASIRHRLGRWIRLLAILLWMWNSLQYLGIRRTLLEALVSPLSWNLRIGALVITLGGVLGMAFAVWAPVQMSRVVRYLFDADVYPHLDLTPGSSYTFNTVVHYLLLTTGVLLGVGALGIDMTKFTMIASALGVGIGFGLQNIVNNFISGLILLFERPVEVGNMIEVSDRTGQLTRIGLRASVVRTLEGSDVIIPNGELLSKLVTNWTLRERRRLLKIPVGVAYGASVEQVEGLLLQVASSHSLVLQEPAPAVLLLNLGDSALEFELRVWTANFDQWAVTRSHLLAGLYGALNNAGVDIPYPTRTLQLEWPPPSDFAKSDCQDAQEARVC